MTQHATSVVLRFFPRPAIEPGRRPRRAVWGSRSCRGSAALPRLSALAAALRSSSARRTGRATCGARPSGRRRVTAGCDDGHGPVQCCKRALRSSHYVASSTLVSCAELSQVKKSKSQVKRRANN